jgi:plasmid stabilization system protein ParE
MSGPSLAVIITKKADTDEASIYNYISDTFGKQYADRFRIKIIDLFRSIALHPFIGRPAKKDPSIRVFIISKQNKLVYKPTEKEVIILRLLNTRTKISKEF